MRAVVQLVKKSNLKINNKIYSSIDKGLLVLLGISEKDSENDIKYIIDKTINLRIFKDDNGRMNESINFFKGEIMVVSQFTLFGDVRKGRRPSYIDAAKGDHAEDLYNNFVSELKNNYDPNKIKTGVFGAMMEIELVNDGPVTILLDSEKVF